METREELLKVSEVELVYRTKIKASERLKIQSSKDAFDIFMRLWDHSKIDLCEHSKMLLVNKACKVLGLAELSTGGISLTVIDPRIVFSTALKANATGIILCHNHPSGNLRPSEADEAMTNKIKEAGRILEIKLLDHLIITSENYFSFADEGLI